MDVTTIGDLPFTWAIGVNFVLAIAIEHKVEQFNLQQKYKSKFKYSFQYQKNIKRILKNDIWPLNV